jgi:hypothetical protein
VLGGRPPRMPLRLVSQSDSVQLLVEQSPNRIGIGYLSHIARRTNVKALEWTVATFLGTDAEVQRYFRDIGIVPAFAQIRLIPEE